MMTWPNNKYFSGLTVCDHKAVVHRHQMEDLAELQGCTLSLSLHDSRNACCNSVYMHDALKMADMPQCVEEPAKGDL